MDSLSNNITKHKLRTMSYSQLSRSGLYSSTSSIANSANIVFLNTKLHCVDVQDLSIPDNHSLVIW